MPRWITDPIKREAFQRATARRFDEYARQHSHGSLLNPTKRKQIIGGLARAFKEGRHGDSAWGQSMFRKRGGLARKQKLIERGIASHNYYAELGREGGHASAEARRRKALKQTQPRLAELIRRSRSSKRDAPPG